MNDGMTPEHRERLKQWAASMGEPIAEASRQPDASQTMLVEHLTDELLLLIRVNTDAMQMESMTYYAQAIIDVEYFMEHGVSAREGLSGEDRALRAHNLIMRLMVKSEKYL